MNTYTHKPTQEIYIHVMGGKSFHSIIYIMPAAIPMIARDERSMSCSQATCAYALKRAVRGSVGKL